MQKSFNLIGNHTNQAGLQKDYELLKAMLEARGNICYTHQFQDLTLPRQTDYSIFLEVVAAHCLQRAKYDIFVPNSEWYFNSWDQHLQRFSRILCKTHDCFDLWSKRAQNLTYVDHRHRVQMPFVPNLKVEYLGFESADFFDADIPKQPTFLHLAGRSLTKNTAAVVRAWKEYAIPYPLILVSFDPSGCGGCQSIHHHYLLGEREVRSIVNSSQFHIMPSASEGFGHAIMEATGCKGIVLTTDAEPMRSFSGIPHEFLIPVERSEPAPGRLGVLNSVHPEKIAEAVHRAAALPPNRVLELSEAAREGFLFRQQEFRQNFAKLMEELENA